MSANKVANRRGKTFTYRTVAFFVKPLLWLMSARKWAGVENFPATGGLIVASNHASNIDPLTMAHFVYNNAGAPKILAKASLWKIPVVGFLLRKTGQIPVERGTANAAASLKAAKIQLDAGNVVAVFPEGTLTKDPDLWPMVAKTGVARLALISQKPVIPVAQWNVHEVLPQKAKFPTIIPRKKVQILAGPPVELSDLYDQPLNSVTLQEATRRIMQEITALLGELRGQTPPTEPYHPAKAKNQIEPQSNTKESEEQA